MGEISPADNGRASGGACERERSKACHSGCKNPWQVSDPLNAGVVARAHGMSEVAREAGVSSESLYRALSADGNPELATILRVMRTPGLRLSAAPAPSAGFLRGSGWGSRGGSWWRQATARS